MVDVARLRECFAAVAVHGDELRVVLLLGFVLASIRRCGSCSRCRWRRSAGHFAEALVKIVTEVDDLEALSAFLTGLGRDHRKFAVAPEHYDVVGAALLATLEHFAGEAWTPELAADWKEAYQLIGSVMSRAAVADEAAAAGLVAGHGGGVRAARVRRGGAVGAARAAAGVRARAVGGGRDGGAAAVVAVLLDGQRAAARRVAGVPCPDGRRRRR